MMHTVWLVAVQLLTGTLVSGQAYQRHHPHESLPNREPDYEEDFDDPKQSPTLVSFSDDLAVCGWPTITGKIIGGEPAERGEFPSLLSLRVNGRHLCGASLISPNFALTAAHCLEKNYLSQVSVVVREYNIHKDDIAPQEYEVYPDLAVYHARYVQKYYDNDIGLLHFRQPIKYDQFTKPACIPSNHELKLANKNGIVPGWGKLKEKGEGPETLMKVVMRITTMEECVAALGPYNVASNKFCAGYLDGHKDACQGDSGGPIYVNADGYMIQVGITSSGVGCGREGVLGLYTRLSSHAPWILKAMSMLEGPNETVTFEEMSLANAIARYRTLQKYISLDTHHNRKSNTDTIWQPRNQHAIEGRETKILPAHEAINLSLYEFGSGDFIIRNIKRTNSGIKLTPFIPHFLLCFSVNMLNYQCL
ncbi:unnamed protein product [Cyprideis torosa]|uniref:Uncharacterized protein n=1 Tax=Cyprideis torosa TaxID=163714 RepID=A0A7R8W6T7_9CRUS|nr:unnamed protein product [Cyprideis torosa]CAG0885557.1 unnamed protein product [Cyprideis torosa]